MPDWVRNRLICNVKTAKKLLSIKNGKLVVDFNNLIKMPEHQPDLDKPNPFLAKGDLSSEDIKKYNDRNWYEWSYENWGCKWNAYTNNVVIDEEQDIAVLDFDTPYNEPKLVIERLFFITRKDRILWSYEDMCNNLRFNIRNLKSNYSKVSSTKELEEYMDLINRYMKGNEKLQEWESEM